MAGLGDMKGLGSALPDRGGGKKKADPEADGDDDEDDPDVRAAPPDRPLRDVFDAREASRQSPRARDPPSGRSPRRVPHPSLGRRASAPNHQIAPLFPSLTISLPSLSPVDSSPTASTRRR